MKAKYLSLHDLVSISKCSGCWGRSRSAQSTRSSERPMDPPPLGLGWAHVYLAHEWRPEAARCYRNAATIEPDAFRWLYYLGRALDNVPVEAAGVLAQSNRFELDRYAPAHIHYANALRNIGEVQSCATAFRARPQTGAPKSVFRTEIGAARALCKAIQDGAWASTACFGAEPETE